LRVSSAKNAAKTLSKDAQNAKMFGIVLRNAKSLIGLITR